MNCTECQDLINAYLGDELEGQLRTEVESHLTSCPDCNCEAANWQTCFDCLRKTFPEQAPPAELWEKIRARKETQS
jgi:anti-sigma factor RsiW